MTWFYNSESGQLLNESGIVKLNYEIALKTGTGWHELPIPESDSASQAESYVAQTWPTGTKPTTSSTQAAKNSVTDNPVTKAASNAAIKLLPSYALDVSGLKDWFYRGLMVFGGLFLMGYGVAKLTGAENKITEIASKIPAVPV